MKLSSEPARYQGMCEDLSRVLFLLRRFPAVGFPRILPEPYVTYRFVLWGHVCHLGFTVTINKLLNTS